MIGKSLLIVISALVLLNSVHCELKTTIYNTTTYVTCSIEKASNESENKAQCPINSKCIETPKEANSTQGFCLCKKELILNRNFNATDNSSVYCIEAGSNHSSTAAPVTKAPITTTTLKPAPAPTSAPPPAAPTTTAAPKVVSTVKPEEKKEPVPDPQKGFFGTILVPVMIVLAFIGMVFAVKKYDLLDRAHSYIRNRGGAQQHQTRYDGLENDFDDDPLLI